MSGNGINCAAHWASKVLQGFQVAPVGIMGIVATGGGRVAPLPGAIHVLPIQGREKCNFHKSGIIKKSSP
jgi:hypothetical protein